MGPLPVKSLRAALEQWLDEHDCRRGVHFYSQEEWAARQEGVGENAPLSAVIEESRLYHLVNTLWEEWQGDPQAALDDLGDLLASRGYYYELGYAWSVHFYPLEVHAPCQP